MSTHSILQFSNEVTQVTLQFLDKRLIGAFVIDAWQNQLNTETDPADGQWFTNDPNNNGGLYGKLTDTLASELVFDESKKIFTPHQVAAVTAIADNRNGLTPNQTVTLSYSYQDSTSSTHSTTNALKVGIGIDVKFSGNLVFAGTEVTTKFSVEYSYSWTDATTITKTETKTFTQAVPVQVPLGKVYQVVLLCNKDEFTMPYSANIYLSGQSVASFASPVNGQKSWIVDAGTLCMWIQQYGSAGVESYKYGRDPKDPARGMISLQGSITATQTANFTARTLDITDTFRGQAFDFEKELLGLSLPVASASVVNELAFTK